MGMKQKLALIIAFASHRNFLICDEPTTASIKKAWNAFIKGSYRRKRRASQHKQNRLFFTENELQNISGRTLHLRERKRCVLEKMRVPDHLNIMEQMRTANRMAA